MVGEPKVISRQKGASLNARHVKAQRQFNQTASAGLQLAGLVAHSASCILERAQLQYVMFEGRGYGGVLCSNIIPRPRHGFPDTIEICHSMSD